MKEHSNMFPFIRKPFFHFFFLLAWPIFFSVTSTYMNRLELTEVTGLSRLTS